MHEHIKWVIEKTVLTNIWGTAGFTVPKLIHVLKEGSASSDLKTAKKPLMLQVWKFLCVPTAQIFTTSRHVFGVLQTSISSFTKFVFLGSLPREEGEASSALFWKLKGVTCLLEEKCPDYGYLLVTFSLKMQY